MFVGANPDSSGHDHRERHLRAPSPILLCISHHHDHHARQPQVRPEQIDRTCRRLNYAQTRDACRFVVYRQRCVHSMLQDRGIGLRRECAGKKLDAELTGWLNAVDPRKSESEDFAPPIKGCKAIIAPCAL